MDTSPNGEHYMRFDHGNAAKPFYIRPTDPAKNDTDIRYGDEVKIAYSSFPGDSPTSSSGYTCGLYGCRVARMKSVSLVDDGQQVTRDLMKFNHGNSAQTFYLRKTRFP